MKRFYRIFLVAALILVPCAALAHVRLITSGGAPLRWAAPASIGIVINDAGSDDISDDSDEVAIRMAIEGWNDIEGTTATLVENTSVASQARTDFDAADIHLVLFDENDDTGFFPGSSGTVALTPIWFFSNGVIQDADVLFNGQDHGFTTSQAGGDFDVQDVAAHELGHLLGLNHSGWAGSTMFPYVDPTVILHRSLSEDEERGLRDAYPALSAGRITGTIQRAADSSAVAGAHVVATDAAGRTAASILANASGVFTLSGLDPGTYSVYAVPLDSPVSVANLGGGYTVHTDFEPAVYPTQATIAATETVPMGVLQVGANVTLALGTVADVYPVQAIEGDSQTVIFHGTGLNPGSTLTASDPDLILNVLSWLGSQVVVQVTVPAGEAAGHVDLTVTNGTGDVAILPSALEITPPPPDVTDVAPGVGPDGGGTALTITGTEFHAGSRIVIGDQIYQDGVGGTTVVDETTITLTSVPTVGGVHDVVVIDPSGIEGRLDNGFVVLSDPRVNNVFPVAGDVAGGTEVVLIGQDFVDGLAVRIDGVDQGAVTVESTTKLSFTTLPGVLGGPYTLEVENPDGGIATQAFAYAYAAQPDPVVSAVDPEVGSAGGGTTITVTGANFDADAEVLFGADPDTGLGGTQAASVTFVDGNTLTVETPQHAKGDASVMVRDASTGQADVLDAAFTFAGGGGGGGCYTVPVSGPQTPRDVLEGLWWIAALLVWLGALAWNARRRPVRV